MASEEGERRLAAILSADVAGYAKLMGDDERATVLTLSDYREVFADHIGRHKGRVVDLPGDNLLAEFASPVEAVDAAIDIQRELGRRNRQLADHRQMHFRIGVNLGDVIAKVDGTIYGDGVNIAARLEGLAEPGGICISGTVFDQVNGKVATSLDHFGEHEVKNIDQPVRAYRVALEAAAATAPAARHWKRPAIAAAAVLAVVSIGVLVWQKNGPEAPATDTAATDDPVLALPTGPSIAVLPFENLSADPEQDYFVDGLTEEIISALTKSSFLFVIGGSSSFRYKGKAVDFREVGRDLNVHYVVEGSVRRDQDRIRINVKVFDTTDGRHLWGHTYDEDMTVKNIFDIQDDIAAQIGATVTSVGGGVIQWEYEAAKRRPANNLSSYDCVLLAYQFLRDFDGDKHARATTCLDEVTKEDPDYAQAWTMRANLLGLGHVFGFGKAENPLDEALRSAQKGVEVDPDSSRAHYILGWVHYLRRDVPGFLNATERSLKINPHDAFVLASAGLFYQWIGQWEYGFEMVEKAMALDPHGPVWYQSARIWDGMYRGNWDQSIDAAKIYHDEMPTFYWPHFFLCAAYAHAGRIEEAKAALAKLLEIRPDFGSQARAEVQFWLYIPEVQFMVEMMVEGLRKAGLEVPDEPSLTD